MTTFRYCCLGFVLAQAWNPPGIYFQIYLDAAVTATFDVLVNTYLLNFRLALRVVRRALVHLIIYLVIFNGFAVFNFPFFNIEQ